MPLARALPLLAAALLLLPLAAAAAGDDALRADWERWRAQRLERLRAERGWLSLVDLAWLSPGENRVPGLPGTFTVKGAAVELAAAPGDGWRLGGEPVTRRTLAPDVAPAPDLLSLPPRRFVQLLVRGDRLALRVWDADSPLRRDFRGTDTFPHDPRWRVVARWEPYPSPRKVQVPTILGTAEEALVPGRAVFEVDGRTHALEPVLEGGALFFVFRDATAGKETYGSGRFLHGEVGADGRVVLDFNRAYSPPCAFTSFATCPLPRRENVLPFRIEAGEQAKGH